MVDRRLCAARLEVLAEKAKTAEKRLVMLSTLLVLVSPFCVRLPKPGALRLKLSETLFVLDPRFLDVAHCGTGMDRLGLHGPKLSPLWWCHGNYSRPANLRLGRTNELQQERGTLQQERDTV